MVQLSPLSRLNFNSGLHQIVLIQVGNQPYQVGFQIHFVGVRFSFVLHKNISYKFQGFIVLPFVRGQKGGKSDRPVQNRKNKLFLDTILLEGRKPRKSKHDGMINDFSKLGTDSGMQLSRMNDYGFARS